MAERSEEVDLIFQKLEIQRSNYEWQLICINNADAKAGFLITLNLALLGFMLARFDKILPSCNKISILNIVLLCLIVASILLSLWFATMAIWPRLSRDTNSIFYFNSIRNRTEEQYKKEMRSIEPTTILDDIDGQVWVLSGIAKDKFANIRNGIKLYGIGIVSLILIYLKGTANG
jgi:hypothetical protein